MTLIPPMSSIKERRVLSREILRGASMTEILLQWCAGHSDSVHVNLTPHILVISQPKWLKFCFQAHFLNIFGHLLYFQSYVTFNGCM